MSKGKKKIYFMRKNLFPKTFKTFGIIKLRKKIKNFKRADSVKIWKVFHLYTKSYQKVMFPCFHSSISFLLPNTFYCSVLLTDPN